MERKRRSLWGTIVTSERVDQLTDEEALLYTWLIPMPDDEGRMQGKPKTVQMKCCPGREWSLSKIERMLKQIRKAELIYYYEAEGNTYIQIREWEEHQTFHGITREPSKYPPPPEYSTNDEKALDQDGLSTKPGLVDNQTEPGSKRREDKRSKEKIREEKISKEKRREETIYFIFRFWNKHSPPLINHKELTTKRSSAINARLNNGYSTEDIKKAIKIYANALSTPGDWWHDKDGGIRKPLEWLMNPTRLDEFMEYQVKGKEPYLVIEGVPIATRKEMSELVERGEASQDKRTGAWSFTDKGKAHKRGNDKAPKG